MTLVLAMTTSDSIWLTADRRLTIGDTIIREDSMKIVDLTTSDGIALLAYAGLGESPAPVSTPISDWVRRVLKDMNLGTEESIALLTQACYEELPKHLSKIVSAGDKTHVILVPAIVDGEARMYTIHATMDAGGSVKCQAIRVILRPRADPANTNRWFNASVGIAGSGQFYVGRTTPQPWDRGMHRLLKAYDRGKIAAATVAAQFACLNRQVSELTPGLSVGPSCIVAWKNRTPHRVHKTSGGVLFFDGDNRVGRAPNLSDSRSFLPVIARGIDIGAVARALVPITSEHFAAKKRGQPGLDLENLSKEAVANIPDEDRTLK